MPQLPDSDSSTEPALTSKKNSPLDHQLSVGEGIDKSKRGELLARIWPIKRDRRKAVFYDSPGLLEQAEHWGALVIWTIAAGTTAAVIWGFLGKVDQTVMAIGTLEPVIGKVAVNTPTGGIVRRLFVKEGEEVSLGDPLMVVQNEGNEAQLAATRKQLAIYRYENQLYNLLLDQQGNYASTDLPDPPALIADEDKTRSLQLSVQETASRLRQLRERLASENRTIQLKKEMLDSIKMLYESGGYTRFSYLAAADELQQLQSRAIQSKEEINAATARAGRQIISNNRQILNLEATLVALKEQRRNLTLKAVQSGTVFNLMVAKGSVIGNGAEVMRIIPDGGLKAKVFLSNSDLGFVREGMPVKIAVSSFPPGEYGYLKASVLRIGADSLRENESSGRPNTFPMIVELEPNEDKKFMMSRLAPGMQVSTNVIVRQRPVITLLTDVFTKGTEDLQNSR
ncbi:Hemolysin secretion protein D, chromosomal [Prochlorococcus marinus str. MIT 1342]|nr:Hemolysin secretion protein D, chromosomal [Prochlorococcus marinus str. MIT 1342]